MKQLVLFLTCLFISLSGFTQVRYSLKDCIETAISNSNLVKQSALQVRAAAVNHQQARLNMLPTINGNISHGINQGRSIDPFTNSFINQTINYSGYNLGSSAVLFNGLSMQHTIKQMDLNRDAAEMDLQQMKDNLSLNVVLAYLQVLSNEDFVEQASQQVQVSRKQVERLEVLHEQGAIDPPQLHDLRGQLKDNELTLVTAKNALAQSKLSMSQLMTIPYDPAMQIERMDTGALANAQAAVPSSTYEVAKEQLALVKAARFRTAGAGAGLKAVRGQLFPVLFISGNVNTNYSSAAMQDIFVNSAEVPSADYVWINGNKTPVITMRNLYDRRQIPYTSQLKNNLFSNIALGLRIPIFNSFQVRNRIKLADIELKNLELSELETQRQLRQEVEQAHMNLDNAYERYRITLEQVAAYAESFRAAEVRFNAGVGNSVDYLVAKNNADRARLNLIIVQYEYMFRKKIVDFYNGERW